MGISPEQIKNGLEAIVDRQEHWPPNAKEFRQMCIGFKGDHSINSTAYIDFNDPRHPSYQPIRIENLTQKEKRVDIGNKAIKGMKDIFS